MEDIIQFEKKIAEITAPASEQRLVATHKKCVQ